jgi:hypothetical protein
MQPPVDSLVDRRWVRPSVLVGLLACVAYVLVLFLPGPIQLIGFIAFVFAVSLTVASIGVYYVIAVPSSPRIGLIAAVANAQAASLFVAMALVQLAIRSSGTATRVTSSTYLALDVAWDMYLSLGTVLFGVVLVRSRGLARVLGVAGVILGSLLAVFNIATFPAPPADAGLLDLGPFVGIWYLCLTLLVARLHWRASGERGEAG